MASGMSGTPRPGRPQAPAGAARPSVLSATTGSAELDRLTLKAVAILAGAVESCAGPSNMASHALQAVLKTRSRPALAFAGRAFDLLEPRLRRRIADTADRAATDLVRPALPRFLSAPLKPVHWEVDYRKPGVMVKKKEP